MSAPQPLKIKTHDGKPSHHEEEPLIILDERLRLFLEALERLDLKYPEKVGGATKLRAGTKTT